MFRRQSSVLLTSIAYTPGCSILIARFLSASDKHGIMKTYDFSCELMCVVTEVMNNAFVQALSDMIYCARGARAKSAILR